MWFSKSFLVVVALLNLYPWIMPWCRFLPSAPSLSSLHHPSCLSFSLSPLNFSSYYLIFLHFSSFFAPNSSIRPSLPPRSTPFDLVHRFPAHRSDVPASWQRPRGAAADRPPGLLHQHPQWGGVHPRDPRPECKCMSRRRRWRWLNSSWFWIKQCGVINWRYGGLKLPKSYK